MTDEVEAAVYRERVQVRVNIRVDHLVTVTLDTNSGVHMDDLKEMALAKYHEAQAVAFEKRMGRGNADEWSMLFKHVPDINVGTEQVKLVGVVLEPKP